MIDEIPKWNTDLIDTISKAREHTDLLVGLGLLIESNKYHIAFQTMTDVLHTVTRYGYSNDYPPLVKAIDEVRQIENDLHSHCVITILRDSK